MISTTRTNPQEAVNTNLTSKHLQQLIYIVTKRRQLADARCFTPTLAVTTAVHNTFFAMSYLSLIVLDIISSQPNCFNTLISLSCGTLSYALLRSINNT